MTEAVPKNLKGVFTDAALLDMMLWGDDYVACGPLFTFEAPDDHGFSSQPALGLLGTILDSALSSDQPLGKLATMAVQLRELAQFVEDTVERAEDYI